MKLKGEVALITGSGRGLGRATALAFAREGAKVIVNYSRSKAEAEKVVDEIQALGSEAIAVKADVSKWDEVRRMVDAAVRKFGRIDILVNNAGIHLRASFENITEEIWDRELDVNLKGAFLCVKAVAPIMLKQKYGKIINLSSTAGMNAVMPSSPHYAASKTGIIGMTKSLANQLAPHIRVNAIAPGFIMTDLQKTLPKERLNEYIENALLKRLGQPEDVAKAAVFLASSDSDFITGHTIVVDGGLVMP